MNVSALLIRVCFHAEQRLYVHMLIRILRCINMDAEGQSYNQN